MPPSKPPRMTANPVRPARYRPGKPITDARSSSEDDDEDEDASDASENKTPTTRPAQPTTKQPPPKATSFPADAAKKVTSNLRNVDLNERRRQEEARERAEKAREYRERQKQEAEAGFVTESDSDGESSEGDNADTDGAAGARPPPPPRQPRPPARTTGSASSSEEEGSDEDSDDEDSDSSDSSAAAAPRKRAAPVFLRKNQRNNTAAAASAAAADEVAQARAEADAARRAAETDAIVQERLERDAIARAAGKKSWDDDEPDAEGLVDDTDGLDPTLEHAQWVARELGRLKRARAALEEREAEIAEVERRRALATPEREAEDRARVEAQQEEKQGRNKAAFMQRYHHKGAFYNDDDAAARGLLQRDLMGATYEGSTSMKEALPQYLQVRDETMIGRKGRTRYRDLKSEDTGRWGDLGRDPRRGGGDRGGGGGGGSFGDDERFRPDRDARGPSGANASAVGERKRPYGDGQSREEEAKRPRREEGEVR